VATTAIRNEAINTNNAKQFLPTTALAYSQNTLTLSVQPHSIEVRTMSSRSIQNNLTENFQPNQSINRTPTENLDTGKTNQAPKLVTPKDGPKTKDSNVELYFSLVLVGLGATILVLGNKYWSDRYYTPEEGLGYYLGLVGGILMLLAFGYTVFQHTRLFGYKIISKFWLKMHLICGILGPFLIIFHSTFRIGSINGGIALTSMIAMFLTGVMARFIYPKTRLNASENKQRIRELKNELKLVGRTIHSQRLDQFTETVLNHPPNFAAEFWAALSFNWRSRLLYIRMSHDIHINLMKVAKQYLWKYPTFCRQKRILKQQLREYIIILKKVALFRFYARFFYFWRNVHIPLSWLLLMSGVVHVVAVHMF